MLTGSCHCQTVQYEISQEIRGFMHCHCQTCRKIHGTVYGSSALVAKDGFKVVAGEEALTAYESTPGKKRCFCSRCGTHVYAYFDAQPDTIILRLGTIRGDPGIRPRRIFGSVIKHPGTRYTTRYRSIQSGQRNAEDGCF